MYLYRFGAFQVDPQAHELRRSGVRVKIQEQPFVVLLKLLERPGELVTREELRVAVWPGDTFVDFDTGLNTVVKRLREVLRDSVETPIFIETVPKMGYRFIAPVEHFNGERTGARASRQERPTSVRTKWAAAGATLLVAAAIVVYSWARPLPPPAVSGYVQITNDGTSKVSPLGYSLLVTDGARIYFTHAISGEFFSLAQVSAAGGETIPVRTNLPSSFLLDISPNHSELLIVNLLSGETESPIWQLPTVGGSGQRVGDLSGHDATWSADGQNIFYANRQDLFVAPRHGGQSRKIASLPGNASWVRSSPDGGRLRFTVQDSKTNSYSLWGVSTDGTNLHPLLPGWSSPAAECCGNWTPDGKYFLFQSTRAGKSGIYAMAEPRPLRRVRSSPVLLTTGPLSYYSPVPSLDGRRVYVVGSQPRGELQQYNSHTHQPIALLSGLSAEGLDFSRDGKWVAYVTFPEGSLWRSRADGSERVQLTFPPFSVFLPRWSPDGKRIAFAASVPGKAHSLYWVSADGGNPEQLTRGEHNEGDVGWSADGNQLVFGSMGGNDFATFGVRLLDLETHKSLQIPESEGLYSPRWSPDGKHIAALNLREELVLFDFGSKKWARLPGIEVGGPNWSRDSKFVYFDGSAGNDSPAAFYRVRISDLKLERVFDMANLRRTGTFQWTGLGPDDSLLFLRDIGRDEIYALEWQAP